MSTTTSFTRETIERDVIAIIESMISDWELDRDAPVGPKTRLVEDLDCASIDVVQLIVDLQGHFGRRDLPFEQLLMSGQRYVSEIHVRDVVEFLFRNLNA